MENNLIQIHNSHDTNNISNSSSSESKNQYNRKYVMYSIIVIILCIFDIVINVYTLIPIKYNEPTNVVNINCNSTYLTDLIISYCPNHYDTCYFPNGQWYGFQILPLSFDILILLTSIINLKTNNVEKSVLMLVFIPLLSSIIFYITSNITCSNHEYKCQMINTYCDEINKYCDEQTRNSCNTTSNIINFDYKFTDVNNEFQDKMIIFKYLYFPMILIIIIFGNLVRYA